MRVCVHSVNQRTEEHRADQRQTAGGLAAGAQSAVLRRVAGANDVGLADDGHRLGLHNPGNGLLALVARAGGVASVAVGAAVSVVRAARGLGERAASTRACAHNVGERKNAGRSTTNRWRSGSSCYQRGTATRRLCTPYRYQNDRQIPRQQLRRTLVGFLGPHGKLGRIVCESSHRTMSVNIISDIFPVYIAHLASFLCLQQ